jgi:Fe-S-cluster containining protein
MAAVYEQFDDMAGRFIELVSSRFGPPTCTSGCSNCCRVSVGATTAEALTLLSWLDEQPAAMASRIHHAITSHVRRLYDLLAGHAVVPSEVHRAVWSLGDCPFLKDRVCGIYSARPVSCRAVYVWHDSSFCGLDQQPSLTPAELIQLRNAAFFDTLEDEIDAGRLPFWGQLTLVTELLRRHGDEYRRGRNLRPLVDPLWIETGLICFAGAGTAADVRSYVEQAAEHNDAVFRSPRPHGLPRALMARERQDLLPLNTPHAGHHAERDVHDTP